MRHRPFTLVLAGGGARGYAHAGVLRALEHMGLAPSGIVGVSMGAVVGATYALREDWYEALMGVELADALGPESGMGAEGGKAAEEYGTGEGPPGPRPGVRELWSQARAAWNLLTGWGGPEDGRAMAMRTLGTLLGGQRLEHGRIPLVVCATDLLSGSRVELSTGPAAEAVYASSALAGILPPAESEEGLLVDGVYADVAPVDVARRMGSATVIAVDPGQPAGAGSIGNGLQVVMRAMEICHLTHAHLRIETADVVLHPVFDRFVDVLDFGARRHCVAAGWSAAREHRNQIERALHA